MVNGNLSGRQGEPRCGGDCRGEEQEGCLCECNLCKEMPPEQQVGGTARSSSGGMQDVVGSTSKWRIENHQVVRTTGIKPV